MNIVFGRTSLAILGAFAAVRVGLPLAALAASGSSLPGLPRYDYAPTNGDAAGFYAASRELLASSGRFGLWLLPLALAVVIASAAIWWAWRRGFNRAWLIVAASALVALVATAAITQIRPSGAAVIGWPLIWSLPMLPYRALGFPLDPDIAFGFGLVISLLANVVTLVATAFIGLYVSGRRSVGLAAAGLYAFWPLLVAVVAGERAWGNGTWNVDTGLAMYTEPVSTALVATAMALVLSPRLSDVRLALAGAALGLATVVKLSNGALAAIVLAALVWRLGASRTAPYAAACAAFALPVAVFWPKGYSAYPESVPSDPVSTDYVLRSWTDSLVFTPRTLLVLVPLAVVGVFALRRTWDRALLAAWALVNPVLYSFYRVTFEHPRFLFASLPAVFVLWVLGAFAVGQRAARYTYTAQSRAATRR
jgi:hypothetical protein